ncbi:MAG: hypothetical protein R2805_05850 [Flavobacterium sp.]|uniref:hypothetical protein n=1 Tax=Flavobacterium sp. TaxID=239 RepID=UPI003528B152
MLIQSDSHHKRTKHQDSNTKPDDSKPNPTNSIAKPFRNSQGWQKEHLNTTSYNATNNQTFRKHR